MSDNLDRNTNSVKLVVLSSATRNHDRLQSRNCRVIMSSSLSLSRDRKQTGFKSCGLRHLGAQHSSKKKESIQLIN